MSKYEALLAAAKQLPPELRVRLIDELRDTLLDDSHPALPDEWIAEIGRRSAEFAEGKVEPIPWETVRLEARRRSGIDRSSS